MVSVYYRGTVRDGSLPHRKGVYLILKNHKLKPLTDPERKFAEENHNLIYGFLHRYGYDLENYYDIAVFGYLKAVQVYHRREDLRDKYDFPFISWQYMRAEIGNHLKMQNAKKRKPMETVVSLDAEIAESGNLYNLIGGGAPESEVMETELLAELLNGLSDRQRKITEMKIHGYSNREAYSGLEIKPSTYYTEVKRIKAILEKIID